MPEFNNLNDLFAYVKEDIENTLRNDVAMKARKVQQEAIDDVVYDAYNNVGGEKKEPYWHKRRRDSGGLRDERNMIESVATVGNNVILSIRNMTMSADGRNESQLYIAELVEYGQGKGYGEYSWRENRDGTSKQYKKPRPFTRETMKRLDESGIHIEELKKGLKARGYDIG